jgi:hypothetical protein
MLMRAAGCIALVVLLPGLSTSGFGQDRFERPKGEPENVSVYREVTDSEESRLTAREWRLSDGFFLESTSNSGERHVVIVNDNLRTQAWHFENESQGTAFDAVLARDRQVEIRGRIDSSRANERVSLRDRPWLQSIERSLRSFVLNASPGDQLVFEVLQPDNLTPRSLQARYEGRENITIGDEQIATRRIRISLPGIASIFWSSDYWFRNTDGLFVRSIVTRGPPGTPPTTVTLVED